MHKKEFTSFDVAAVVRELRENILDSRINNIYQVDAKTFKVSLEELQNGLRSFSDVEVVRALPRFLSIGGIYAEEVLLKASVDKAEHCKELSDAEIDAISENIRKLLSQVLSGKLELTKIEEQIDGLVAKLYGISDDELREIKRCLKILKEGEIDEEEMAEVQETVSRKL